MIELMELDYKFILLVMDAALFGLGVIMVLFGLGILAKKAFSPEVANLANATSKLAQKGIADDIAGLVGNASALMNALQDMVKTARAARHPMSLIITRKITANSPTENAQVLTIAGRVSHPAREFVAADDPETAGAHVNRVNRGRHGLIRPMRTTDYESMPFRFRHRRNASQATYSSRYIPHTPGSQSPKRL